MRAGCCKEHTASPPLPDMPACASDPNDAFSFVGDHGPSGIALDGQGGVFAF